MQNNPEDLQLLKELAQSNLQLKKEIEKVIVGQKDVINQILISIFSNGHALLVGVPGLAKTLLVNTISETLGLSFNRIQFTPDLMPSDIIGSEIFTEKNQFEFIKGPVFTQVLLADEINRTPPKTQAALLESMQEKKVSYAGKNHILPKPFFVLATQNPVEQEGTYPLPEAQLDRFMFNIWVDYPSFEEEVAIVNQTTNNYKNNIETILNAEKIIAYQNIIRELPVSKAVTEYAVKLCASTRPNTTHSSAITQKYLNWGAGPRASQYLIIGAKTHAALNGKFSPDIEDVKAVALPVLRHRLIKNYHADADGLSIDDIIKKLL
jgi:MoxR-like ATPase